MHLSKEIVIIAAALGAVVFLFLMDYYYQSLEAAREEHPIEPDEPPVEVGDQTDEPNIAA